KMLKKFILYLFIVIVSYYRGDSQNAVITKPLEAVGKYELNGSVIDFKNYKKGDYCKAELILKNISLSKIEIDTILQECSCVSYKISKMLIPVGDSTSIQFFISNSNLDYLFKKQYLYLKGFVNPVLLI